MIGPALYGYCNVTVTRVALARAQRRRGRGQRTLLPAQLTRLSREHLGAIQQFNSIRSSYELVIFRYHTRYGRREFSTVTTVESYTRIYLCNDSKVVVAQLIGHGRQQAQAVTVGVAQSRRRTSLVRSMPALARGHAGHGAPCPWHAAGSSAQVAASKVTGAAAAGPDMAGA